MSLGLIWYGTCGKSDQDVHHVSLGNSLSSFTTPSVALAFEIEKSELLPAGNPGLSVVYDQPDIAAKG